MAVVMQDINPVGILNQAEDFLKRSQDEDAEKLYASLLNVEQINTIAYFRLGEIYNRQGRINESQLCHLKSFELNPCLAQSIMQSGHPSYNYRYSVCEEVITEKCPLCGRQGTEYSCYNMVTNLDFIPGFDPIRLWMYCEDCNHIFAYSYPRNLGDVLTPNALDRHLNPNTSLFPQLSITLGRIRELASGDKYLEVGVGAGEMAAVAREMLFDVTGLDIRPAYAEAVTKTFGIPVDVVDFLEYQPGKAFDVISMGDVLEHMTDPVTAVRKACSLLSQNGILWISTPNFDSAFSHAKKDGDPMWRVCEHLNYFSYRSLRKLLADCGLEAVDYRISAHYNGSMEVTSLKKS